MKDAAVVILNWNGKHFMEKYLPTLVLYTCSADSFIVIADNGSTDGSVEWIKQNYPDIRIIEFDMNYGFTGGYNRALKEIDADYYVLLNSDIEVTSGWLDSMVSFMEENPDIGICQPKILSENNKDYFEYAGACGGYLDYYGYPFCRGRILSNVEKDNGQYNTPAEVFWASGACMMIRSSIYHHLGGFDECFFAHMEEIDLCWRSKLLGYQVWAYPASVVYHVGGGTLPNNSPRKLYLNYRNNLLMLYKNLPTNVRDRKLFVRKCLDGASAMVYILSGRYSYFKVVLNAHRDFNKMKKDVDVSSFSDERNDVGLYGGSIVLKFFLSGTKLTFGKLRF
ncbi:MAG: glycosyltransferase family 2 protein [Bacteroidales bacterium]